MRGAHLAAVGELVNVVGLRGRVAVKTEIAIAEIINKQPAERERASRRSAPRQGERKPEGSGFLSPASRKPEAGAEEQKNSHDDVGLLEGGPRVRCDESRGGEERGAHHDEGNAWTPDAARNEANLRR